MYAVKRLFRVVLGEERALIRRPNFVTWVFNHPKTVIVWWLGLFSAVVLVFGKDFPGVWKIVITLIMGSSTSLYTINWARIRVYKGSLKHPRSSSRNHCTVETRVLRHWYGMVAKANIDATQSQLREALIRTIGSWRSPGLRDLDEVLRPTMAALKELLRRE